MKTAGPENRSASLVDLLSPLDPSHGEAGLPSWSRPSFPDAAITCSSDLGRIGLLERENAGLLNAAPGPISRARRFAAFEKAIPRNRASPRPCFITQNDGHGGGGGAGTPPCRVYSFASGATNSMRGRGLSLGPGRRHGDRCRRAPPQTSASSSSAFPREANSVVKVGGRGARLFRMPDLLSIGLGGGQAMSRLDPLKVRAGVGRLPSAGRTAIALRRQAAHHDGHRRPPAGRAGARRQEEGRASRTGDLPKGVRRGPARHGPREAIDRMKTEAGDVPLIAVGGRGVPDSGQAAGRLAGRPCRAWPIAPNAVGAPPSPRFRASVTRSSRI